MNSSAKELYWAVDTLTNGISKIENSQNGRSSISEKEGLTLKNMAVRATKLGESFADVNNTLSER